LELVTKTTPGVATGVLLDGSTKIASLGFGDFDARAVAM